MKRVLFILAALAVVLCGCTQQPQETAAATEPTEAVTLVNSVDELLAAIEPGATIELGEGEFNLTTASDYGERKGPYYVWESVGLNQYGLKLQYVDGLTIRGQGMDKTTLVTEPRWPHVLSFADSENVTLEGMTIGHTVQAEACDGGVVYLEHCENVVLKGLGLYGCGTIGVWANSCEAMEVADCDIYDCSGAAISLGQCTNVQVRSSRIYSLGREQPVSGIFQFWTCEDVTVEDCTIRDNYAYNLILSEGGAALFRNNRFTDNQVAVYAFGLRGGVVFDNNSFVGTEPRVWYGNGSEKAVDPDGNPLEFEREVKPVEPGVAADVATGEQKEVKVKTVDQFLAAIASNTKILLPEGTFDLSTAKNYGKNEERYYWEDNYDGPSLVIANVENLTIQGAGQGKTILSAVPRYANVLTFEGCSAITVKDLTAGHTIEPGTCMGGVLMFRGSSSLLVESCGLYGCGTYGVQTQNILGLQVVNCEIYECSYGGVNFWDSEDITISGTTFRDLEGPTYNLWNCKNVASNGDALDGNYNGY